MALQRVGLVVGVLFFVLGIALPPLDTFRAASGAFLVEHGIQGVEAEQYARSMQVVAGLILWMVVWWITEAIPLAWTALLPVVVVPLLSLVGLSQGRLVEFTIPTIARHYVSPVVLLFFGGFLLAASMRRWHLDRRITLWILTRGRLADSSRATLFGMMGVSAFLSMWISNTATCAMMLPLSLGILGYIGAEPGKSTYGTALMLGIAWAASIGGVGSLIGTPPNGIAVGVLNAHFAHEPSYQRTTFLDWMAFGVPLVAAFLPIAWFVLVKLFPPEVDAFEGGKERLLMEFRRLGKFSRGEKGAIAVFSMAVVLWLTLPFREQLFPAFILAHVTWLDEYTTGLLAGLLLFVIPVNVRERSFLLHWTDLRKVEWAALAIVGGGIALSDVMFKTGFASWIARTFITLIGSPSTLVMMFAVVFFVDFLTEIATNSAVISMMAPVVISIAQQTGENPVALTIAAAIASSMAFMLPVATPPNAIVYGTGYVRMKDMMRAGIVLDIVGWLLAVGVLVLFGWLIFGVISL